MATHSSQSVLSEEEFPSSCHDDESSVFQESTGDVEVTSLVTMVIIKLVQQVPKRKLSLLVDMSSKSIEDVGMATDTTETTDRQPQ